MHVPGLEQEPLEGIQCNKPIEISQLMDDKKDSKREKLYAYMLICLYLCAFYKQGNRVIEKWLPPMCKA